MQVFRMPWGIAPPRAALVSMLGHAFRKIFDFRDELFKATEYVCEATGMYGIVGVVCFVVFGFVAGAFVEQVFVW